MGGRKSAADAAEMPLTLRGEPPGEWHVRLFPNIFVPLTLFFWRLGNIFEILETHTLFRSTYCMA